jgi:CheY-like chemotaxis protein
MPHALIVDDSKTARYALRQLLDKHQFSVDMVESAEQALEYLHGETPDVIFMDHMMPGMDGFQAVKAIKSNPATTAIPIVMYTSTQGGMYFGQARALGAADVIAKPATNEDLSAVLQRLEEQHLLGAANRPTAIPEPLVAAPVAAVAYAPVMAFDTPAEPEHEVSTHEPLHRADIDPAPVNAPTWLYWIAAALLFGAIWVGGLYYSATHRLNQLLTQHATVFKTVEWALNLAQEYPYGEAPFSGERLQHLQELVEQLKAGGFRGTIRLESHAGEFCLLHLPAAHGQQAVWVVAPPELMLTDCSALGQNAEQAQKQSEAQSQAFRRYVKELEQNAPGIRVEIVALGASEPAVDYPTDANVSAGAWNRVAQRNQRVHVVLEPDTAGPPRKE